ncbi:alpha-tocopherol transfer protein-like [Lineus longissimus]|uniref:alpha-tocopherol transfer protein-like n=1 Tax=Lineus longissimus TaxID=88925 RepID=UPI002B4EF770
MASQEGESYVWTLGDDVEKIAKNEINELPEDRANKIELLRQWVKKHPYIDSRTDDRFLLKFLRAAKFSLLRAQEKLTDYIIARTSQIEGSPEWFNTDPNDKNIQGLLEYGVHIVLPGTDPLGRRVIMVRQIPQVKEFSQHDMTRLLFMSMELLLRDELAQINGIVLIVDCETMFTGAVAFWTRERMKRACKCWQDALPMRMKAAHYLQMPAFVNVMFEFCKIFLSRKMAKRLHLHSNLNGLYQTVPKSMLPKEYGGGAGPLSELKRAWIEEFSRSREYLLSLAACRVDDTKLPRKEEKDDGWGMVGTYRKLPE